MKAEKEESARKQEEEKRRLLRKDNMETKGRNTVRETPLLQVLRFEYQHDVSA